MKRACAAFIVGLLIWSGAAATTLGSITVSALGNSNPLKIGATYSPPAYGNAISIGLICTLSAGASLTYSVQVTADAVPSNATGNWNNHDIIANLTASANSNIAYPVTALRVNVSSYSSGSVTCGIAQWP